MQYSIKFTFSVKVKIVQNFHLNERYLIPAPKLLSIDFSILIKSCHFSEPRWKAGAKLKNIYQIYTNNQE